MQLPSDPGQDDLVETHDINVTPFIDVILVLLIIFMVAAPLSTVDLAVDLPVSSAQPQPRPDTPVSLTLRPDLTLAVNGAAIARDDLAAALETATQGNHDTRLSLRADKSVSYGDLMVVMDRLRAAGFLKVALVGVEHLE